MPGYVIAVGFKRYLSPEDGRPLYWASLSWPDRDGRWNCEHAHASAKEARVCARVKRDEMIAAEPEKFSELRP